MRIALYHNLTSGGSKREAYEFAKQFVRSGHTVHLFRPSTANEQFLSLSGIVQRELTYPLALVPDLPLRVPGLTRYIDLAGLQTNLRRLRGLAQKIATDIDAGGYDFVFAHHDRIVPSPYLFRDLKTPSLYYCAEPMRAFYEPPVVRPYQRPETITDRAQWEWYARARTLRQNWIKAEDARNVRQATQLLTNSFFSAESIFRAYGLQARVVYLGVDASKFRPLNLPKSNYVLSVGAISPLKNYDFIISALGQMPARSRPELVLVGNSASGRERKFLERLARAQEVSLKIRVDVNEEQLVELYNRARAFVYAPQLEPFGLAPMEAMSCGVPVVAVKEGGVRESVVEGVTGLLVERVPQVFAQALERLLSDEEMQGVLGQNGRAHVRSFWTWEHAGQRFEDVVAQELRSLRSDMLPLSFRAKREISEDAVIEISQRKGRASK